jgi:hypothetical protein
MKPILHVICSAVIVGVAMFSTMSVHAGDIELTLKPEQELNRIDEKVYSHFLEHIYHSVNGGLWGELANPK